MSNDLMSSKFTIMIPPLRPDRDFQDVRNELRKKIKEKGTKKAAAEMVEDYYRWKDDPSPISARRKKRATLIFSKKELEALVPMEIHNIIGDVQFLSENYKKTGKQTRR